MNFSRGKPFDIFRLFSIILFLAALALFTYAAIVTNILGPIELMKKNRNFLTDQLTKFMKEVRRTRWV